MLLRQLGVCLWWRDEAFYPGWSVGAPGGGCLPSLLTHNPLQTPQLFSNPLWLTTPLSGREIDLFICFCCCLHPSCVAVCGCMCPDTVGCFRQIMFKHDLSLIKCIDAKEQSNLAFCCFERSFAGSADDNASNRVCPSACAV